MNKQATTAAEVNYDAVIGENVHQLMWRAKDTQTGLAPALGITQASLSLKLRGRRPWFANEISAVAQRYNVSYNTLFSEPRTLDYKAVVSDIQERKRTARRPGTRMDSRAPKGRAA